MKVFTIISFLIATSSAGSVDFMRCGASGTFSQLRCTGQEGPVAIVSPGTPLQCEGDLIPAMAASELRLKISVTYLGMPISIIDTNIPNSSVQPGQEYTIIFSVSLSAVLTGNTLPLTVEVINQDREFVEVCIRIQVRIL